MPTIPYNFTDNAEGFLSVAINESDTSLPLRTGEGVKFSASNFVVWCQAECMIASSRNNDTLTISSRGAYGTGAVAHSIYEPIREKYSQGHYKTIVANIISIATATPNDISASGLAGTSASTAANDHVHKGVTSVTVSGNPNSYGVISLIQGQGASLSQSGGSITIGATGGGSFTLNFNNNPILSGQATLVQGTGASLSQSGASITIGATGGCHTLNFNNNPVLAGQTTLVQGTSASLSQSGASITIGAIVPQGLVVDASTPIDIASAAVVGISASATHGDHTHRGVLSISVPTMAALFGGIALVQGTGASLSQNGASVTIGATGGCHTLNFNNNPILAGQTTLVQGAGASLSQSGASITIGAAGGSFTLNYNNNPILTGQATLVQGAGASLSQSGASITIGATGGAVDIPLTWRVPITDQTITANYSAYVSSDYEIGDGLVLDILNNAIFEIG